MAIQYHYNFFPPQNLQWEKIIPLIGPATAAIAYYDGGLAALHNADVLLSPLTTQEAVLSSRIEDTQATMAEVLEYEAAGDTGQYDASHKADIHEVLNYRKSMHEAEYLLGRLPLSQRLLKELHRVLLNGVRGQGKAPGEYRKIPNWIGPPGCSIDDAYFVPISADKLAKGMDKWENFIHEVFPDALVQLAILHVEFEALHPFLDGNGRLGRMFIPLFLWQRGLLSRPAFYVSATFEKDRETYYEKLRSVSRENAWENWIIFFLHALKEQAISNAMKVKSILNLYDRMKMSLPEMTNTQYAIQLIDWIFKNPIFSGADYVKHSNSSATTSRRILSLLVDNGVLKVIQPASGRKTAVYSFPELLNVAEGRTCF